MKTLSEIAKEDAADCSGTLKITLRARKVTTLTEPTREWCREVHKIISRMEDRKD